MNFKVVAVVFGLLTVGCVSVKDRMSCENTLSDMGFVECDSPKVSACGVTLLNCEDGASYFCVNEVVCENKGSK